MKVTFWGTRGSLPTPLTSAEFFVKAKRLLMSAKDVDLNDESAVDRFLLSRPMPEAMTFGGNTPCIEIIDGSNRLIIDCGSGLYPLGRHMMSSGFVPGSRIDILQTHTHWDHMLGFPFFAPAFTKGTNIHIHGIHPHLGERFEQQMDLIHFPIEIGDMAANVYFEQAVRETEFGIPGFTVSSKALHHPGGSYAYRITAGDKTVVIATDGEYKGKPEEVYPPYVEFYQNADLLVFDAMYSTLEKVIERENFGHSTPVIGIRIAMDAGVKKIALFHHDPECNDAQIAQTFEDAREYLKNQTPPAGQKPLDLIVTYDGLEIEV